MSRKRNWPFAGGLPDEGGWTEPWSRSARAPRGLEPPPPPCRLTLRDRLHRERPLQAVRAARTFLEFLSVQEEMAKRRATRPRRRPVAGRATDDRLWLDPETYVAWTIDGELVEVLERDPSKRRWCQRITPISEEHRRLLFSFNVFVPTVIALYRGDRLGSEPVTRYIPHYDVAAAHRAARRLAEAEEQEAERAETVPEKSEPQPAPELRLKPATKTRFHPQGNFVLLAPVMPDVDLPPFAVFVGRSSTHEAFESRRHARRAAERLTRGDFAGLPLREARVLGAVDVEPVFRPGLDLPKSRHDRLMLLRREPRLVLPELRAAWLPRSVQTETGEWVPQPFRNRRTVRSAVHRKLLEELGRRSDEVAGEIEAAELARAVDATSAPALATVSAGMTTALRAQRRLPETWLRSLELPRDSLGPDWRDLASRRHAPPRSEDGHWLRAPIEFGKPHPDGLRSRIVELQIDDLAGLIELAGWQPTFWLIKESTSTPPRWVLPLSTASALLRVAAAS